MRSGAYEPVQLYYYNSIGKEHDDQSHAHSRHCCTANSGDDYDGDMLLSRLSIDDEELREEEEEEEGACCGSSVSESDEKLDAAEDQDCYSMPTTPLTQSEFPYRHVVGIAASKEYASENESQSPMKMARRKGRRGGRKLISRKYGSWVDRAAAAAAAAAAKEDVADGGDEKIITTTDVDIEMDKDIKKHNKCGGGGGALVITKAKGGRRSLHMDFEEVKACRDLGFELEHVDHPSYHPCTNPNANNNNMTTLPFGFSPSASTTSSGTNSPIPNWNVSSPGDDPRDVKARLKVWAHAVALASTSASTSPGGRNY